MGNRNSSGWMEKKKSSICHVTLDFPISVGGMGWWWWHTLVIIYPTGHWFIDFFKRYYRFVHKLWNVLSKNVMLSSFVKDRVSTNCKFTALQESTSGRLSIDTPTLHNWVKLKASDFTTLKVYVWRWDNFLYLWCYIWNYCDLKSHKNGEKPQHENFTEYSFF